MAELRTVFTDDDGDGVYDDVHVVNVMDDSSHHAEQKIVYKEVESYSPYHGSTTPSIIPLRKKLKIALKVVLALAGFSIITKIIMLIIALFVM